MARINLRPWREERNAARQKQFLTNLVITLLISGLIVFAVGYYYNMQVERQAKRNTYLKTEIASLDRKLREIQELKRQRERLLERLNAIQQLQGNRPVVVRTFDELVRILPDQLHYQSLSRNQNKLTINGLAERNRDVSELMRSLDASIWFGEPNLTQVNAQGSQRRFNLSVPMTMPEEEGKN